MFEMGMGVALYLKSRA